MSLATLTLPEFDDEMDRTRAVLAAVPKQFLDWKPAAAVRSVGWNANHLAEIVGWTADILAQDEFDLAPPGGPKYETPSLDNPQQIVQKFDAALAAARALFATASDEKLAENWTMKMGGQPLFTISKGACIRKWVLNHTIHHRAILSIYLRICGVEVTPVYDG